jgi:alkylation response protein AidB-like acyl-CoA dehydrogenase
VTEKRWGAEPYFGLGYEWDPEWVLTDRQKQIRDDVIELCEREMRANAKRFDDTLEYPRRNFELLAEKGLLALTVPTEYGGLGENHVTYAMVCETIARYGCASTAMCYVMHMGAVNAIMLRATPEHIDTYIRPLNSEVKIGTLSYSDPETGSHFWYPVSSGARRLEDGFHVRKKASWTTSAGFADFYVVQTTSPDFSGYDDLSVFVVDAKDAQAKPELWDALGLRGNQSGSLNIDADLPAENIVGPVGDGAASNDESVDPWFLIGSSSCWNGISLGAIDIAKRHTTRKKHVDVGLRVCDYPTIQDYVGESLIDTNACRMFVLSIAQAMDKATQDNTRRLEPGEFARADFLHWAWQIKFSAAKNVASVCDVMLHACGGSAYKRDMEMERYLRDGKAGWVMGPTNEVLRQFVGKAVLLGFDSLDYWNQAYNQRAVENEVKKLDPAAKRALADQLLAQASEQESRVPGSVSGAR